MELLNKIVVHKTFGKGEVFEQSDSYIMVRLQVGEKKFVYPDAFEKFLTPEEQALAGKISAEIALKKDEVKRVIEQKKDQELKKKIESEQRAINRRRAYPKENIAFKCNYCDGGQTVESIGYVAPCSDEMIHYNIDVAAHSWCCDEECACRQYYDGVIDRAELDAIEDEGSFVCYESQMLRNWAAFAGYTLKGEEHIPMKLSKVQIDSLAILTTREPNDDEKDRFVFAVFMVDEAYEGDNRDAGYVTTSSQYKISLTRQEAKKFLFWNYYHNENAPQKIAWGQGLHRYIADAPAAKLLHDIWLMKKGTEKEELTKEFFEYFCKINDLDPENLPTVTGGLELNHK